MMRRGGLAVAALTVASLLTAVPAAALSTLSVGQILATPQRYDGQHVEVTGMIEKLEKHLTRRGNAYVTFWLCSDRCVSVYASGATNAIEGETVTITGTFAITQRGSESSLSNVIEADEGSI